MAMAPNPSGGGNPSGFNVQNIQGLSNSPIVPVGQPTSQGQNPLLPSFPANGQSAPINSPYSFPANGKGAGPNPSTTATAGQTLDLARGFRDAGIPSAIAQSLSNFINSGSGYNSKVLQSLFAALQPQIQRGEADILEHFGSMGLGMSSPAAIGLGDFLSQVNLNEGEITSQLYEQSIQNYLSVLLGGSHNQSQDGPGFWQGLGENLLSGILGKVAGKAGDKITGLIPGLGG